jgi:hypothetical protein
VGGGANSKVHAFCEWNGNLYVGGRFSEIGGSAIPYIARWDGASWHALGSGVNGYVWNIVVWQDALYVCGQFTTAGGTTVNRIARWDGSAWSSLNGGVSLSAGTPVLYSMEVTDEGRLIAGGSFSSAGGVPAADIAEWTGSAWVPLGDGTPTVYDLDSDGPLLYAVCNGTGVSRWNGSEWSILGKVWTAQRKAIVVSGNEIYIVGVLLSAAGGINGDEIPSYGIAHWTETVVGIDDRPAPSISSLDQNFPNPFNPVTTIRFQLEESSRVRLDIFDVRGALVRTLVDGARPAGGNLVTWDGKNDSGQTVSSGVYFYRLTADDFSHTKKMVLLK